MKEGHCHCLWPRSEKCTIRKQRIPHHFEGSLEVKKGVLLFSMRLSRDRKNENGLKVRESLSVSALLFTHLVSMKRKCRQASSPST
jgi:hypothetical protein